MIKEFEYLKKEFPKKYISIVLEHQAVNKVLTFCDNENQYLLFTGMFSEVNGGKGINDELESYLVNYLVEKYKIRRKKISHSLKWNHNRQDRTKI